MFNPYIDLPKTDSAAIKPAPAGCVRLFADSEGRLCTISDRDSAGNATITRYATEEDEEEPESSSSSAAPSSSSAAPSSSSGS